MKPAGCSRPLLSICCSVQAQTTVSPPALTEPEITAFQSTVYDAAVANPRSLPWRDTTDPYCIMVSEIMLQQTQAERVTGKYLSFIKRFPDLSSLASAEFSDVLTLWQGLGYNRRALSLKRAAGTIITIFNGDFPTTRKELESLPGIGPYTAGAIITFAFDKPEIFVETNIRSVYIHHFFNDHTGIHDRELLPLVDITIDRSQPRKWYNALMDYGTVLKRQQVNPSRRSIHHARQTPFEGSNRQLRSALLREILAHPGISNVELTRSVSSDHDKINRNLEQMTKEGLITSDGRKYVVA